MNYFGMVFSFMVPGVILGLMAALSIKKDGKAKGNHVAHKMPDRKEGHSAQRALSAKRLYVYDLRNDTKGKAA